jgi:hypothetical protein
LSGVPDKAIEGDEMHRTRVKSTCKACAVRLCPINYLIDKEEL